jgi:hypothetical protein
MALAKNRIPFTPGPSDCGILLFASRSPPPPIPKRLVVEVVISHETGLRIFGGSPGRKEEGKGKISGCVLMNFQQITMQA